MKLFIAVIPVIIGLGIISIWSIPGITNRTYKFGFLLGLAACGASIIFASSSSTVYVDGRYGTFVVAVLARLVGITPFVLLVEAGVLGYRGFSSWMRNVSLSIAVLGVVAAVTSLLLPRLIRR